MGRKSNKQKKNEREATFFFAYMIFGGIAAAVTWMWEKVQSAWAWVVNLFSPIINFFG